MKDLKLQWKNEDGGYSIETAIIMTITFVVILFLIFMTFVMYEQVRLNAIAQDAAERGAVVYAVKSKEMITGRIEGDEFNDQNVYWRLFNSNKREKIEDIKEYVILKLNKYKLDNELYDDSVVSVDVKNYFLYKRIEVEINVEYKVPFGGILNTFGFVENPYKITAVAWANVSEPAEFIRNLDFGSDMLNGVFGEHIEKYTGLIQKAINWLS